MNATNPALPSRAVRILHALAVACVAATSWPAAAQDQGGHTLDGAVQAAVRTHPSMAAATGAWRAAGEGVAQARAAYYPQVSAGITSEYRNHVVPPYERRRLHHAGIGVSQLLYDFGKVSGSVEEAQAAAAVRHGRVLMTAEGLARDAARAWIELRRHDQLLEVARAQIRSMEGLLKLVQERARQGASARSDLVQAQSRLEWARSRLMALQAQHGRWQTQLMRLMGLHQPPQVRGDDRTAAELVGTCQRNGGIAGSTPASVQVSEAEYALAQARLRSAKAEALPTLSLDASVRRGLGSGSRIPGESASESSLMLNFGMPWYAGGALQARERAAAYEVEAAEASLAQERLEARQGLEQASVQIREQVQRAGVLGERARSMEVTRDLYREQYLHLGSRSLLDLLNAEQEVHEAAADRIDNEHDIQALAVDCLYHAGLLRGAFGLDTLLPAQVAQRP